MPYISTLYAFRRKFLKCPYLLASIPGDGSTDANFQQLSS